MYFEMSVAKNLELIFIPSCFTFRCLLQRVSTLVLCTYSSLVNSLELLYVLRDVKNLELILIPSFCTLRCLLQKVSSSV